MRLLKEDRTSRAVIRDEALRLFAENGADGVTVRQIAAAAGVSPALVIRHYGSKERLSAEVNRYVLLVFDSMLRELTKEDDPVSLAEAITQHLPPDSPIPRYLSRMLLERGTAGRRLFRSLFKAGQRTLRALAEAGRASQGDDPDVRAAFLTANDLAALLLRKHLAAVLGFDPLSREGMARWGREVLTIYGSGIGGSGAGAAKEER